MRKATVFIAVAFLLVSTTSAFAEHAPGERHTYRTLLTVGGAIGGFAAGAAIGAAGDSEWRGAAAGAVVGLSCGIVGGYLLGRKIDKSRIPRVKPAPDPQKVQESLNRAMDLVAREYAARLSRPAPEPPSGK